MKMFLLTAKLGEFNYDKDLIEHNGDRYQRPGELADPLRYYPQSNLALLQVKPEEYSDVSQADRCGATLSIPDGITEEGLQAS